MYKNLVKIPTANMNREEWLEIRRHSVGGSDAAAIVGLNEWSSPYSLWAEKTGRLPEKEETEAMRQGTDLESYVAKRWEEETGKKVKRCNAILKNPLFPFAHANIDRDVVGEDAGLECKTTSVLRLKEFRNGEFPDNYYVQCVHYMAVTGAARWYLAVLVLNKGFYHYTIERDDEEIRALMDAEARFWEHVQKDEPPTVDGSNSTSDAIGSIYQQSSEYDIDLFGRASLMREYMEIKAQKRALDRRLNEIENTIKADMQDAERAYSEGYKVSWKTQARKIFKPKLLELEHPEIILDKYCETITSRPFKVSEIRMEEN